MAALTAEQAAGMSREEALRVLAVAEGVPEKDRRLAQLMLAGPQGSGPSRAPRRRVMHVAVHAALAQHVAEARAERAAAAVEVRELGGYR